MQDDKTSYDETVQSDQEVIFELPPEAAEKTTHEPDIGHRRIRNFREHLTENIRGPVLDNGPEPSADDVGEAPLYTMREPFVGNQPEPLLDTIRVPFVEEVPEPLVDREAARPAVNPFFLWLQRAVAVVSIFAISVLVFLGAVSAVRLVMDAPNGRPDFTRRVQPAAKSDLTANASLPSGANISSNEHSDDAQPTRESEVGASEPPASDSDVTINAPLAEGATQSAEPLDLSPPSAMTFALEKVTRSTVRRKKVRPRAKVGAYVASRPPSPSIQPLVPLFFPTTLVIYVENGAIKTRVEPWLQSTSTPAPNN